MKIGYARVSTQDQSLDRQIDALKNAGCEMIYAEKASGKKSERLELKKLLANIRKGDEVTVTRLSRIGRSVKHLVELSLTFQKKGVEFKCLHENIDTTTAIGKFTFHLFAALAEFQADLISEGTKEGLAAARKRGKKGGRPKGLSKKAEDKARLAEMLYTENERSISEICEHLEITKTTLYRYLRIRGVTIGQIKIK